MLERADHGQIELAVEAVAQARDQSDEPASGRGEGPVGEKRSQIAAALHVEVHDGAAQGDLSVGERVPPARCDQRHRLVGVRDEPGTVHDLRPRRPEPGGEQGGANLDGVALPQIVGAREDRARAVVVIAALEPGQAAGKEVVVVLDEQPRLDADLLRECRRRDQRCKEKGFHPFLTRQRRASSHRAGSAPGSST